MRFDPSGIAGVSTKLQDSSWHYDEEDIKSRRMFGSKIVYKDNHPNSLSLDKKHLLVPESQINSFGFRSDEFINYHNGKHVLFAGCSVTFGDGLYLNETWAHKLYSKLSEEVELSGYFNVASQGIGMTEIFKNVTMYIDKFGSPDIIFMVLPNLLRFIDYRANTDDSGRFVLTALQEFQYTKHHELYQKALPIAYLQYLMIEQIAKLGNSRLYITSDRGDTINLFKELDADRFFGYGENDKWNYVHKYQKDNPNADNLILARDSNGHPGIGVHEFYANFFYNLYKDNL